MEVEVISQSEGMSDKDFSDALIYQLSQRMRQLTAIDKDLSQLSYLKCTKEELQNWLRFPQKFEKRMRDASKLMYDADGHYRRLVNYMPNMLKMAYVLEPASSIDSIEKSDAYIKSYRDIARQLDIMNIRTEMNKPLITAMRDGIAFCYAKEERDAFTLQMLNPDFCRTAYTDASGCIRFEFNFSYFSRVKPSIRDDLIKSYGDEFWQKWTAFMNGEADRWQYIEENGLCIKPQEDTLMYSIPPYISVLDPLFDLLDYKKLAKAKEENGNYNLLGFEIPTNNEGKVLMDKNMIMKFIDQATSELPSTIGTIVAPMKISKFNFAKENTVTDNTAVSQAEQQFWSSSGVSDLLFGASKSSTNALSKSIIADQIDIYPLMRQIERWINRRLLSKNKSRKFKIKILDVTSFNETDMLDMYKKAGDAGLPVKLAMSSIMGYTPYEVMAMSALENEVLEVRNNMYNQPLFSSSTMSTDNELGGRPTKDDDDLSDSGQVTRETDGNVRE